MRRPTARAKTTKHSIKPIPTSSFQALSNAYKRVRISKYEPKETKNTTSFPLQNFHAHQIRHMEQVLNHRGLAFVILCFSSSDEIFLMEAQQIITFWNRMLDGGRKSITKKEVEQTSYKIPIGFQPRIDYLKVVDQLL